MHVKEHPAATSRLVPCVKAPDDGAHGPGASCGSQSGHAPSNDEHLAVKTTEHEQLVTKKAHRRRNAHDVYLGGRNFSCCGDLTCEEAAKMVCRQDHGFIPADMHGNPLITLNTAPRNIRV